MKYLGFDNYQLESGEPALRSCPECNSAHEHLRDATVLHSCFVCGRYWIFGKYLDKFATTEEMDAFLKDKLGGDL